MSDLSEGVCYGSQADVLQPYLLYPDALWQGGMHMKDAYEREMDYRLAKGVVRSMRRRELITYPEFCRMNTVLIRELHPVWGQLSFILDGENADIA